MIENYNIPLNYKEGTYNAKEIKDFVGETINIECVNCDIVYRYVTPKYDREVLFYEYLSDDNVSITATYDSNGVIKYIKFHRGDNTKFIYINFKDNEHTKESVLKYSYYWSDRISEKILEHTEKIARLFIDYSDEWCQSGFFVNAYTPEDVQQAIDDYNKFIESAGEKYRRTGDYHAEDESRNYRGYTSDSIEPDIQTLEVMLKCANRGFADELYELAVTVMTERIKNNVLDKIDKTEDFKFISASYSD